MSSTPSMELDPLFVRALRLLHSKAKDSTEQLKQLLDDVVHQKSSGYNTPTVTKQPSSAAVTKKLESTSKLLAMKKPSPKHLIEVDFLSMKTPGKDDSSKKNEKRPHEKIKQDIPELIPETKRACFESPKSSPPQLKMETKKDDAGENLLADVGNTDADDFAMEMGLACVVCRNFEISPGNQFVECQDCHNLYHQECHKPPVPDQDINDPRVVWYCTKCTKNIKKMTTKTQKTGKMSPASTQKEIIITKPLKPDPPTLQPTTSLFKRSEVKNPVSSVTPNTRSTNPGNKPTGLAGLAASLSGKGLSGKTTPPANGAKSIPMSAKTALPNLSKASSSSSSSSSTSSSSGGGSSSNTIKRDNVFTNLSNSIKSSSGNGASTSRGTSSKLASTSSSGNGNISKGGIPLSADKRLQQMKKKAEKKLHEKRWPK